MYEYFEMVVRLYSFGSFVNNNHNVMSVKRESHIPVGRYCTVCSDNILLRLYCLQKSMSSSKWQGWKCSDQQYIQNFQSLQSLGNQVKYSFTSVTDMRCSSTT